MYQYNSDNEIHTDNTMIHDGSYETSKLKTGDEEKLSSLNSNHKVLEENLHTSIHV